MTHVGLAARTQPKFRYEGDPREVHLEMSAEAANAVLDAVNGHPDACVEGSAAQEVESVLTEMMRSELP